MLAIKAFFLFFHFIFFYFYKILVTNKCWKK